MKTTIALSYQHIYADIEYHDHGYMFIFSLNKSMMMRNPFANDPKGNVKRDLLCLESRPAKLCEKINNLDQEAAPGVVCIFAFPINGMDCQICK